MSYTNLIPVLLSIFLILLSSASIVSADGNVTVTSGDLNLLTPGDINLKADGSWNFVNMYVNDKVIVRNNDVPGAYLYNTITPYAVDIRYGTPSGYGELIKYNRSTANGLLAISNERDIQFWPEYSTGQGAIVFNNASLYPYADKFQDLGKANNSWRNCYCDRVYYHSGIGTFSTGYIGTGPEALSAISNILTKPDGEIDHASVDASLAENDTGAISINGVVFANSKAIAYLNDQLSAKINGLEARISELEAKTAKCNN
jgi:hypothetical protein